MRSNVATTFFKAVMAAKRATSSRRKRTVTKRRTVTHRRPTQAALAQALNSLMHARRPRRTVSGARRRSSPRRRSPCRRY